MSTLMQRAFGGLILAASLVAAVPASAALSVKEVKSPGGLSAYLAEDHTSPIIAITFGFNGGSALDPANKLGLSSMVTSLLDEGAGDLDSFAFQSALADRAISLRFSVDKDMIRASLVTTTANAPKALELMHLALTKPRFDPEPVERIRRQIEVEIASREQSPNRIARNAIMQAVFPGHPYAREDDGTRQTISSLTADDLRGWVKSRFGRDRLLISASGDITAADLGKAMDQLFGDLPKTTGLDVKVPEVTAPAKGQVIRVEKNLPQTITVLAEKGLKRKDPDWYIATVDDYILGGGSLNSRLMNEVREKRGLAYTVSSSLAPYDAGALVFASVGTRADQAATSLNVIRDEWKKMHDQGPTQDELNDAKQFLTGAWPLRFTTTGSIAEILLSVQKDNLGIDYIDKRNSIIEAVTLADAKRVAKRIYDPDALTVVVVGATPKAADPKAKAAP